MNLKHQWKLGLLICYGMSFHPEYLRIRTRFYITHSLLHFDFLTWARFTDNMNSSILSWKKIICIQVLQQNIRGVQPQSTAMVSRLPLASSTPILFSSAVILVSSIKFFCSSSMVFCNSSTCANISWGFSSIRYKVYKQSKSNNNYQGTTARMGFQSIYMSKPRTSPIITRETNLNSVS